MNNKLPARHFRLIFSAIMGAMMVFFMTFVVTLINVGPTPDFLVRWVRAFFMAYPIALPAIYFAAPLARRMTARFVHLPEG